jgi:hypothetical protein
MMPWLSAARMYFRTAADIVDSVLVMPYNFLNNHFKQLYILALASLWQIQFVLFLKLSVIVTDHSIKKAITPRRQAAKMMAT